MANIQLVQERIIETIGREKPGNINELRLDAIHIPEFNAQINAQIQKFTHLEILAINACAIKSLKNLPDLKLLKRIELDSNDFPPHELINLAKFPLLQSVTLSDNKNIKVPADIQHLTQLKELYQLDL